MKDYYDLLKEYQDLQTKFKNKIDNMNIFAYNIQSFELNISSLIKSLNSKSPLDDDSLISFNKLYTDLLVDLKNLNKGNIDIITIPLQQMIQSQDDAKKRIFGLFNDIKNSLFEGKQKLNTAKNEYLDCLKVNKEIQKLNKKDDNLLFEGKKINYFILYKYEIDKMNENINKTNKKYNELINELELIDMVQQKTYKTSILEFGKIVGNIGKKFIEFEKNISDKFSNIMNNQIINNKENKVRFPLEKLEEQLNIIPENINDNIINNNIHKRKNTSFDFEIIGNSSEDAKINNLMEGIIKKISSEEEITSTEISEFFENIKYEHSKYSLMFLEKVKNFYKNRVIFCKNKQNFIHFSNFINSLSSKKEDIKIFNEIFELCKMISYENVFMSSMIRKQNPFLCSETFWKNFIYNNLILKLSEQSANLLKINKKILDKEIKDLKFQNKEKSTKREEIANFYNQIYKYKNLNKKQKTSLEKYCKEIVLLIVAQSITNMCNFLLSEKAILDIISHFAEIFDLGIESFYYFKNKLSVNFKKNYLKVNENYDEIKDKYGFLISNIELIILNVSKFLPKENYINIFKINKNINSKLRTYLLKYQLNKFNISIDGRIKIWEIILEIDDIKKKYNYTELKNSLKNIDESKVSKSFPVIDLDLGRTPLFRNDDNHLKAASNILKTINILDCCIDYYQGINFVILFLYQLLNHDEEKTFYFMLGLEMKTKYKELFKNDLEELVVFFKVFEKILEINIPEIFYAFLDKQIMTQFYSTSWFITLFTSEIVEFEKEKVPKFILMAFESFLFGGWSGIFNAGLSLCNYNKNKILNYEGSELMKYMIADINNINNISEEDFEILHESFLNYSEKITESYIKKLREIIKFEEIHKQLKGKEI